MWHAMRSLLDVGLCWCFDDRPPQQAGAIASIVCACTAVSFEIMACPCVRSACIPFVAVSPAWYVHIAV